MRSCQAGLPDAAEGVKLAVFVYVDDERRVKIFFLVSTDGGMGGSTDEGVEGRKGECLPQVSRHKDSSV